MGVAFDVVKLSFVDFLQYAKRLTLELKQQLLFDFAVTKQLWTVIPDPVHRNEPE